MILYSTDCPQCKILKSKLDAKKIAYTVVSDMNELQEAGILSVPALYVNNKTLNYYDAVKWVNEE